MNTKELKLVMIGAMYENGGNTTHRFLDAHPEMFVYPFESQVGTRYVQDVMTSLFPVKYRWPVFGLESTPTEDYRAIIDEEGKVRARTPFVSKFRDYPFDLNDDERLRIYCDYIAKSGRGTGQNMGAFFAATFDAWKDYNRTGKESVYVGYSPIITVDTDRILRDMPNAHVLHVVRNPWSAFADTSKRPVPMALDSYMLAWTVCQYYALQCRARHPERVHIVRIEDVMRDSRGTLGPICEKLGIDPHSASLSQPSWNGKTLTEVKPWGTIRIPTPEVNLATARELSEQQMEEIRVRTLPHLEIFDYKNFLKG